MIEWLLAWLARHAISLGAIVVLGLVIGAQYVAIQHLQAGIAEQRAVLAGERATAAQAAQIAEAAARAEEHRRTAAQKEATDEAQRLAARARADAAAADREHDRVRDAAVAAGAAACRAAGDPPAAAGGAPAQPAGVGVLVDVLGEADAAAGELAAALDRSFTAGQLCERAYDALTAAPPADFTLRARLGEP